MTKNGEQKVIHPGRWYTEFDENGNVTKAVYDESYRRALGYTDEIGKAEAWDNWTEHIHPEDAARVAAYAAEVMRKHPEGMDYDVEYRMRTRNGYRLFHDYGYCTRREDGSVARCDGVVFDIQDAVDSMEARDKLIRQMAGEEGVFLIDYDKDTRKTLHNMAYNAGDYSDEEKHSASFARYIDSSVAKADREMMHRVSSRDYVLDRLNRENEFSVYYRDIASGVQRFYEMRMVRFSDTEALQSFREKDREIVEKLVFDRLESVYFGLLVVDLDAGLAEVMKNDTNYRIAEGEIRPYAEVMERLASYFEGDTGRFLLKIGSIDYLKRRFAREEKATYIYKSRLGAGNDWGNITTLVLTRHEDGTPSLLAHCFSLLDEEAGEKEDLQIRIRESMRVVGGLTSEYTALYHVDLDTGQYVPYHIAEEIEDIKPYYDKCPQFTDLVAAFAGSSLVRQEDREPLRAFYPSEAAVREALRGKKKLSMLFKRNYGGEFLWTEADIIKCEGADEEAHNVIVGFMERDQETRQEMEAEKHRAEAEKASRLIGGIVANCQLAYRIDLAKDSFIQLRMDDYIVGYGEEFAKFSEARGFFLNKVAHPADRDRMTREMDYGHIRERLAQTSSYTVEYRALIGGATIWHEMIVTALGGEEVIIGFTVKNLEITKRRLEDRKFDEYLALFSIDLDMETIQPIKVSELFKTAPIGTAVPYGPAMKLFAESYTGEAKDFFTRLSDLDYVKKELATDDKRSYSYRASKLGEGKWIDAVSYVTWRHEDGTPSMLTLGFSLADSFSTARKEIQARLREDMEMIGGLASEYHALYYYNIPEGFFKVYSLDPKKFPEAARIVENSGDPMATFRAFGMSKLVHPDDHHVFEDLTLEAVKKKLAHSRRFSTRFRRLMDGEFKWTQMDVIKYGDIDAPANVLALGFAERNAEIRSEQALRTCFDVLGQEITPQESIDKLLSVAGEFYGAERCYIFEFTENRAAFSNTYEWCAPGVPAMMDKLQGIPSSEVDGWMAEFRRYGAFSLDSLDTDGAYGSEEGRALLEMQGIESLVAAPLLRGEEIIGFIGADNPKKARTNLNVLRNVATVAYSEILKRKENDEEHVTLEKLTDAFVSVYFTDLSRDYMHTWKIDSAYQEAYGMVEHYSVSMGGYVRENIAERDRERCIRMTSPEYVLEQFKTKDRFSIDMADVMLGRERNVVFDYIKVSEDGSRFVVCCRDVTESVAREKEQQNLLEEALQAADAANRSKTSFLFNMSHDIRTPMNAITGFTTMAKKYVDDKEKVVDYLNKIDTSGQQLLALVNQVLEMARIESGRIELEEKPVNVVDEYNSMVTVLFEQAKVNGLDLHHSLSDIRHYHVLADKARMSSITLNITGNAMKYTPRGGRIDFSLREIEGRKPGYASFIFTVADTGIGMSEEYLKVLYDPFTREKSSTVSRIQGTGLGMAIVKDLVDLMGGSIEVHSETGKGTRFDITIDFRIDEETNRQAAVQPVSFSRSLAGRTVLLVEDNALNREIATDILEEEGLKVETAEDGIFAVELLGEKGPDFYDFILMDIQMPLMNGYDATKTIREMYPGAHIPIIALSANAFAEDKAASLAAGMDDHVAKPIDVDVLFSVVSKYL